MPHELFRFIHLVSVILLIAFTFYAFAHPVGDRRKFALTVGGIASLFVFLTGFAMGHTFGWPGWFFAKLVIWVAISAFGGIVFRRKALAGPLGIATVALVVLATWLAVFKPF